MTGPEVTPVTEGAAREPGSLPGRVDVAPGAAGLDVVEEEGPKAADIQPRVQEARDLVREAVRRVPVVVVPVHDDVATGLAHALVALGAQGEPPRLANVADLGVGGDQVADGVVAVIHDDQLLVGVILAQEVGDGARDERPAVVRRHDAGDQGLGRGGHS
jgi:hypothetical protein